MIDSIKRQNLVAVVVVTLIVATCVAGVVLSVAQAAALGPIMDQASALPVGDARVARQREVLQAESDNLAKIWTTVVQVIIAAVLAVGGYFTWRNLRVTQETLKATQDRLEIDREAQLTNRFTQAIGQLGQVFNDGAPNLEVRLGGIYALERIARDSRRDRWTIMEVLTAYVRQHAPRPIPPYPGDPEPVTEEGRHRQQWDEAHEPPRPRIDVQAILTVLARRRIEVDDPEPGRLDLHRTDLRGADLTAARLPRVLLFEADLKGAVLRRADLEGADLTAADLESADLGHAYVALARLCNANLQRARLQNGRLTEADFSGAFLQHADFSGADIAQANLLNADVTATDFTATLGLTPDQIYSTRDGGDRARLPKSWPGSSRDQVQPPSA